MPSFFSSKESKSLDFALTSRKNNLDMIRFFAALAVLFSHSFTLTQGYDSSDLVSKFSGGNLSLGGIAVGIFFFYGGFLIAKSCERHPSGKAYFKARALRIFPELIFVILGTTFIVGPIFTSLPIQEYFTSSETYRYLINILLIPNHTLPGLFEQTPFGGDPNGALWTLPVEFACYIICFVVYHLTKYKGKGFFVALALIPLSFLGYAYLCFPLYLSVIRAILLFCIGVACYVYRDKIKLTQQKGFISLALFVGLIALHLPTIAMLVVFPYMALYFGFGTKKSFSSFAEHGEFSYGIYLWGWPTQQCLVQLFNYQMPWWLNAILACAITIALGFLNNRIVTKPLMGYVKRKRHA